MPSREEVLRSVQSEIDYQHACAVSPLRPDIKPELTAGEYLLAMEHCLMEARMAWYHGTGTHVEAAAYIRKTVALGLRFMEDNAAPPRQTQADPRLIGEAYTQEAGE